MFVLKPKLTLVAETAFVGGLERPLVPGRRLCTATPTNTNPAPATVASFAHPPNQAGPDATAPPLPIAAWASAIFPST